MWFKKKKATKNIEKTQLYAHLESSLPAKQQKVIDEWVNRPKPILKLLTREDMFTYSNLPYDFHDLPVVDYGKGAMRYLISENNQDVARRDILSLNAILVEKQSENKSFPSFKIEASKIRFNPKSNSQEDLENDDYSCFAFNPVTSTGKPTKYPLTIEFKTLSQDEQWRSQQRNGINIFGSISYLANGLIGKYQINCWKGQNFWSVKRILNQ